jgi:HEAT repeat protein
VIGDSRAVAPLVELSADPDPQVRGFSLRALGLLARPESGGAMVARLGDPVAEVRAEAAKGVARLGLRSAADPIAERLAKEPDDELRRFLVATLGDLGTAGNPKHEGALLARLDDDDPGVRMAAISALAKIGSSKAEKPLLKLVEKEKKKKAVDRDPELMRLAQETAEKVKARP